MNTEVITWIDPDDDVPDEGIDVLVKTPSPSFPVWIGHLDDGVWRWCDGSEIAYAVEGWAEIPSGEVIAKKPKKRKAKVKS